jgi:transcriptional regulator with XRE-family HTH domain
MDHDNAGYGAEVRRRRLKMGLKVGDLAAALGVDELALSRTERGEESSESLREAILCQLGIRYSAYARQGVKQDLEAAMDIVSRANVLPFPFRHRVQDDV